MFYFQISALFGGVVGLAVGIFVCIRGKRKPLNIIYSFLSIFSGIWSLGQFGYYVTKDKMLALVFCRLSDAVAILIPVFFLQFVFLLVNYTGKFRKQILLWSYILAGCFLVFSPTAFFITYDSLNRLSNLSNTGGGGTISTFGYSYDAAGNRLSKTSAAGQETYGYDNLNQLTSAQYPAGSPFANTGFNYDPLGNRTTVTNGAATTYTANNLNQYTQVNTNTLNYDPNGNLTGSTGWTYSYDYENRLIGATNGTITASYSFDPFGRRIGKTVNGVTTNFLYSDDDILVEYDSSGNLLRKYVYSNNIDEPVAMVAGNNTYYYNRDGLGTTSEITDNTGAVIEKYFTDVYGKTILKGASDNVLTQSAIGNRFIFTGRELDAETGLYHYRARAYSPDLGRFLQTDLVDYADGSSLYEYCFNNPINYIDSTGEAGVGLIWTAIRKVVTSVVEKFVKNEGKKIAHEGFIKGLREMEDTSVRRTIRSLEKQIAKHTEALSDPNQIRSIPHHQQELKVFKEQLELARQEAGMRGVNTASAVVAGTASGAATNGGCPEKGKGWVDKALDVITDFIGDPWGELN